MYSHYKQHKSSITKHSQEQSIHKIHNQTSQQLVTPPPYKGDKEEEEGLKIFLERKYSQKRISASPMRKAMANQTTQTLQDFTSQNDESKQQLNYYKKLCDEKDMYYSQIINGLRYSYT